MGGGVRYRDMTATGRYPPEPRYKPIAFYSCVRMGDPEQLAKIMATDPYFLTQARDAAATLPPWPVEGGSCIASCRARAPTSHAHPYPLRHPAPTRSHRQDNGAGAPVHFATTYRQIDMVRWW